MTFFTFFNKTLDKHAHMEEGTRKDKKLKLKQNLTKGIIKASIKERDKLHKKATKKRIAKVKSTNMKLTKKSIKNWSTGSL